MAMKKLSFRCLTALIFFFCVLGSVHAWEPEKPIELVIMHGIGGGTDNAARLMSSIIEREGLTPKPVVAKNMVGGSGFQALNHMKHALDPDYKIMLAPNAFFTAPVGQSEQDINVMEFAPIARLAEKSFLLWVRRDEGISSFEEFVENAKNRGSDWVMGGSGQLTEDFFITDYLNAKYGLDIKYIPFKSGGVEAAKNLVSGHINSSVNNPFQVMEFDNSGDMIPLVTFSEKRLNEFPDVPTLVESGVEFTLNSQIGVAGGPNMSEEALKYYQNLFQRVYETEEWQKYSTDLMMSAPYVTGDDLLDYWSQQIKPRCCRSSTPGIREKCRQCPK